MPKQEADPSESLVPAGEPVTAAASAAHASAGSGTKDERTTARRRPPKLRYLGFCATDEGREYSLQVTGEEEPRLFLLFIRREAFASRQVSFQDAPDLCFAKLQRELQADPDLLPGTRRVVTDEEFLLYRDSRTVRAPGRRRGSPRS